MTDLPKIAAAENGPLIVENPPNLKGAVEANLTGKPKVARASEGMSQPPWSERELPAASGWPSAS